MYIEEQNTFEQALRSGINLFLGSGFSILAKDKNGNKLPCGGDLLNELKSRFLSISTSDNLSKACTVLEKSLDKDKFKDFLTERFTVETFDPVYENIVDVNIKNIFSTNIDDLIFKIWDSNSKTQQHVNDTSKLGESNSSLAINYFPLHGCVLNSTEDYIFSNIKIASAFSSQNGSWESLKLTVSSCPIIFWGWSFNDSDIIEAMYTNRSRMVDDNARKWIVLHNPQNFERDFYKSLNFSVIIADTKEILNYIGRLSLKHAVTAPGHSIAIPKEYQVPSPNTEASYPLTAFFGGDVPRWSYIYSGQIVKTHHFKRVADIINSGKNAIIIGIPASGKSTLMMQLASSNEFAKDTNILYAPTKAEAIRYRKIIDKNKVLVFVDNCLSDYRAFLELSVNPNIQVIGFERDNKYESVSFKLDENNAEFDLYDISEIDEQDVIRIANSIPKSIYTGALDRIQDKTIFETVRVLSNNSNIRERFASIIQEMYRQDEGLTELFLMISYVHSCGVPVSYDMIYSYLEENDYRKVYEAIRRIGKLVVGCYSQDFVFLSDLDFNEQDYYQCRTRFLAGLIIDKVPNLKLMRAMLEKFVERVPAFKICRYDIFKGSAFDADIVGKFFTKYEDGIEFYQKCLAIEDSAFMYQQIALYANRKKRYSDAFRWIDLAMNCKKRNVFSIRNTYAIILFNANINKDNSDGSIIGTLHQSLGILQNCYQNDLRKGFHAKVFGEFVLKFYNAYGYDEVEKYVDTAHEWLSTEMESRNNTERTKREMQQIRKEIETKIMLPNQ